MMIMLMNKFQTKLFSLSILILLCNTQLSSSRLHLPFKRTEATTPPASTTTTTSTSTTSTTTTTNEDEPFHEFNFDDPLEFCVSMKGNGYKFSSYIGAFARISEELGSIHCATGGSSSSIMVFLMESVAINPSTRRCNGGRRPCTDLEKRRREALLFKSFTQVPLFDGLYSAFLELTDTGGGLGETGPDFVLGILRALANRGFGDLVNFVDLAALFHLLLQSPRPRLHLEDLIDEFIPGLFAALPNDAFVRTGIVNFNHIAELFGRIGDFYSGYGPYNNRGMEQWLDRCNELFVGLSWDEAIELDGGNLCEADFLRIYNQFLRQRGNLRFVRSRLDEPVGTHRYALVVTSLIVGDAAAQWRAASEQYRQWQDVTFSPSFDDFRYGYFGDETQLDRVVANLRADYSDRIRAQRFEPLVGYTWKETLSISPAEPGLSPGIPLNDDMIAVGGWSDPLRVNVAYGLGPKRVIAVVVRNDTYSFERRAIGLLGASEEQQEELYSNEVESEVLKELSNATGVWCMDWGFISDFNVGGLFIDGYYNSPLLTTDDFLSRASNSDPNTLIRSCSGVAGI
eukprot:CAMPEP_0118688468 /NCGR_PEP_ID=MMETSP0800-20121206/8940_1 /TAXON_ID=210618 ORGANISM="Striatella unipunctata, Strain CCMP2910" /NCGR_SAMPLE_ID=MMETSP0800 /ASSEMBLY_ACC=CAM_ASM_000638 /LENGTH=569 /DNA_ID=CAMNT_0006585737 /DNA_START=167 /DNA_END=1876 /DNA_ORIENTATION=-